MGAEKIYRTLTIEDIKRINKEMPEYIKITDTRNINPRILSELDSKIKVQIVGSDIKEEGGQERNSAPVFAYSKDDLNKIIETFEFLERGIDVNPNWTDMDKAIYLYTKLILLFSLSKENQELKANDSLVAIISRIPTSKAIALIYSELCRRNGLDARYVENTDHTEAFNEIKINNRYYPVDNYIDLLESKKNPGSILIHNFGKNLDFYEIPAHKVARNSTKFEPLNREEVQKSLDRVLLATIEELKSEVYKNSPILQSEKRQDIEIKSKELAGVIKTGKISEESVKEIDTLSISLTDDDTQPLLEDLKTIGNFYPELLNKVKIENKSSSHLDMQKVIDSVYEAKYPGIYNKNATIEEVRQNVVTEPLDLEIVVSRQEDLDSIDLTHVPQYVKSPNEPADNDNAIFDSNNKISFNNSGSTPLTFQSIRSRIPSGCDCLHLIGNGWDLSNADFAGTNITYFTVEGKLTRNIDQALNTGNILSFGVKGVSESELNKAIIKFNRVLRLSIGNQDLHDRAILNELKNNPNLANIEIFNCKLNNLDGLEDFNGRIQEIGLIGNDLTPADAKRVFDFYQLNPILRVYLNGNKGIEQTIDNSPELSDATYNFIKKINENTGLSYKVTNKKRAINYLLWGQLCMPVYIQDAKMLRDNLKITTNPLMLNNDNEINTINFNESHLKDATILLTIPQAKKLLSSGKTIPQNISLRIESVKDLSVHDAEELKRLFSDKGMKLTNVQIIDKNFQHREQQFAPYKIDDYVAIRKKFDVLVSGIDPSEPDIDKFAVIYRRLMDSIKYDNDGIDDYIKNHSQMMRYGELTNPCRNIQNGVTIGKCVCAGYADILRNALELVGVKATFNRGPGHAWNQVCIKDDDGSEHWYNTDLTWDTGSNSYRWTLLSDSNFIKIRPDGSMVHKRSTPNTERCDRDYDRTKLREAFDRAKTRSFDLNTSDAPITIPADPKIQISVPNLAEVRAEFNQRKNDMYAKFYGDKDYEREYLERSRRFKSHRVTRNDGRYDYETIEDYAEKEDDEKFLLLDKYAECLERMTRYQNGDHSVYRGTSDRVAKAFEEDRIYVTTNNHTFNQNATTREDLMTLGKFGEQVPYIPRQTGVLRNIGRGILNAGIFARNLVAPVYRFIGTHILVPIHERIYGDSDASPFRNNIYHRMVARRDYFTTENNRNNPGHPFFNAVKARVQAIFKAAEGNEAVLRAGAADIRKNTEDRLRQKVLISNLANQSSELTRQINDLKTQVAAHPHASNVAAAKQAIKDKESTKARIDKYIANLQENEIGIAQTDAISDKQHAIASKEVNTLRVTAIKGVAKGIAARYIGPKLYDWLIERGKVTKSYTMKVKLPEKKERWVNTTYKYDKEIIYGTRFKSETTLSEMMAANKGHKVTGFYSVYGGENRPATYTLTGNEEITAIFQSVGKGGHGLSDTVGLKAPTLVDGTFSSDLLNQAGKLSQNISIQNLVEAVKTGKVDPAALNDLYVSVNDNYWTKLSDLAGNLTETIQMGTKLNRMIDTPGHMESYIELVDNVIHTTRVVRNPAVAKVANVGANTAKGAVMIDGIYDIVENVRPTTTDKKSNKEEPRNYNYRKDLMNIPKSKKEYEDSKGHER